MGPQVDKRGPAKRAEVKQPLKSLKDPLKPLRHRSFYLDLKDYKGIQDLKEDILLLGGMLENFISKEISCVITNRPINKQEVNGLSGSNQNTQSPIFSPGIDSPSTSDTPTEERKKIQLMSRGTKMLEKAVRMVKGTGDVLQNALKWGVQVVSLPRFLSWLEVYKSKNNIKKIKIDKRKRAPNQSDKSIIHLVKPFLKFEAVSRQYRPVYKQLRKWPELVFDPNSSSSPFSHNIVSTESRKQTGTRHSVRSEHELNRSQHSNRKTKETSLDKKHLGFKRKHGYCEICSIPYTNLYKHLETAQHQKFVADEKNYASLDKVISSGSKLNDYLESLEDDMRADEVKLLTPVAPNLLPSDIAKDKVTPPASHFVQNNLESYTLKLSMEAGKSVTEKQDKVYVEIARNLFPSADVSSKPGNCIYVGSIDMGIASKSAPENAGNNIIADSKKYQNSDSHPTKSASLPDVVQQSNASITEELVDCSDALNASQVPDELGTSCLKKRNLLVRSPTAHLRVLADPPLDLLGDVGSSQRTLLMQCSSVASDQVAHIADPPTLSINDCSSQVRNSCTVDNIECTDRIQENNVTVHKTLRSTIHKRNSLLNQLCGKLPLDLSTNKRECSKENTYSPQSQKKAKLHLCCDTSSPLASINGNRNGGVGNEVEGHIAPVAEHYSNSDGLLEKSSDKHDRHTDCGLKVKAIDSVQVKTDCSSKSRSVLVLTDHSVQLLFNSDNETSDFLGFDPKNCQDLPLDLSYTEMPESSSIAQSILSSDKEGSLVSNGAISDRESQCSIGSENDKFTFSQSNPSAMQETSDSSEEWDHDINLFLDKRISNTITVK